MQGLQYFGHERGNNTSTLRWIQLESTHHRPLQAGHFDLDVEEGLLGVAIENGYQLRQMLQIGCASLGYFAALNCAIMADQGSTVGGQAHVEFEAIATMCHGQIERLERVFGDGAGCSRTAVTQEYRQGHRISFYGSGTSLWAFAGRGSGQECPLHTSSVQ